jgi:hypothetical protein
VLVARCLAGAVRTLALDAPLFTDIDLDGRLDARRVERVAGMAGSPLAGEMPTWRASSRYQ